MSNEAHIDDLLPAYAVGSLEADELRRVEEHLLSCLICRKEASSFEAVIEELSVAAPEVVPSAALKDRLMRQVMPPKRQDKVLDPIASRPFWERLLPAWGLASLFLIVGLAASSFLLWQRVNTLEYATAPGGMRAVPLNATDAAPDATGFVLISTDGEDGALVVDGLPPLGEDREYQLWLVRNGERTSGAIFSTDEKSYAGTRIRAPRSLLDYSAVGITIEPAGGSEKPTGAQVLHGTLPVR
ncbi:MAG TPA: anti-sigma factor [Anaerolineales bacterium]|jgi:anti-sigma-K factor RskA|nr:anti-sigma factor [Anaerolineales bacterium]